MLVSVWHWDLNAHAQLKGVFVLNRRGEYSVPPPKGFRENVLTVASSGR